MKQPVRSPEQEVSYLQESANALCDMRANAAAPLIAEHILANPDYYSWGLAGLLAAVHLTDKADGRLAGMRKRLMQRLEASGTPITDPSILNAISIGGPKDEQSDKKMNHSVSGAIAARETLNGKYAYAGLIGGSDLIMYGRDRIVSGERERAAVNGINGDARKLGKWKQAALVVTQVIAVSPLARPKEKGEGLSFGRVAVVTGMLGGTAMSIYSGVDQVHNLRAKSAEASLGVSTTLTENDSYLLPLVYDQEAQPTIHEQSLSVNPQRQPTINDELALVARSVFEG